ncbi:phosphotransferase [Nocardioides cynanchi]|uniref:phosphotransferase n=1 Tax=Nocardioides cynanchi TaxID=2558918 RepID=UPI0017807DAE|nr:phosphotransferase [Nocardioides cynanchi]
MLDDALLADWCLRHLGAPPEQVLFRSGFLSEVVGVELTTGLRAVVKARPFQSRIAGCVQVQAALARGGFPCPEPLTVATRVGALTVTAEREVPGGDPLTTAAGAAPFAALLARLIASAPAAADVPSLKPSPPWTAWDHPGRRLWLDLDEHGQDLNLVDGPAWVDDAARRVRVRLTSAAVPLCVGHGDWASQNLRWSGHEPHAVHDWDSVIAQPEAAVVGLAAAMWPTEAGSDVTASVAQTADFIESYQRATGREWTRSDVQDAWAAGLWNRLVYVKQDTAEGGGDHAERLATEIEERLDRAALG